MRTPKNQLPSVVRRMRAGQMLVAGEGIDSVARELGISTASARRYKAIIEEGALEALATMSVGGRQPALDARGLEWIANSLRSSPAAFGFNSDQWTDGRLQSVIRNQFRRRFLASVCQTDHDRSGLRESTNGPTRPNNNFELTSPRSGHALMDCCRTAALAKGRRFRRR
jgi:transposase